MAAAAGYPAETEADHSQWNALDHLPLNDDTKPMLISTMNSRYREALNVYARHFCGKPDVVSAQLAELDETKLVLRYWDAEAKLEEQAINYQTSSGGSVRASKAGDVRRILLEMARTASEATGAELDLPHAVFRGVLQSDKVAGAYLLNDFIDMKTLECLNQDDENPVANAIRTSFAEEEDIAESFMQSDPEVDHQLIVKLGFDKPVKLKAITIKGKTEDETAPQVVKLFSGQTSIGFQEAEEQEAVQTLNLSSKEVDEGEPVTLRFVKFQNVTTLQLFVQSNFGADTTRIERIELWGTLAETVDMKAWKPITKSAANPITHLIEPVAEDPTGI
jgi:hypothetical protein